MRKYWLGGRTLRFVGCAVAVVALAVGIGAAVLAASTVDPAFEPVVRRLVADGFSEAKLRRLFSRAEMVFSYRAMADKLTALYMRKYGLKLVADTQSRLAGLGWYPGPVDGRLDRMTKWSIKAYQTAVGLAAQPEASQSLLVAGDPGLVDLLADVLVFGGAAAQCGRGCVGHDGRREGAAQGQQGQRRNQFHGSSIAKGC